MKIGKWVLALALLGCGAIGCDGDDNEKVGPGGSLVGGSCSNSDDCQERCVRGGDYPGGMCTVGCASDDDCPRHTACISDEGGICSIVCDRGDDCADFGKEWTCKDRDRRGHSGKVGVCRGD